MSTPTLHIHEAELQRIAGFMAVYPNLETGGELFGLTMHSGAPVVFRATGPSRAARHNPASFYQSERFIVEANEVAWEAGLQHLGSWHSHHHLGLAEPSSGDRATAREALSATRWSQFLMLIGNFPRAGESQVTVGGTLFSERAPDGAATDSRLLDGANAFAKLRFPGEQFLPAYRPEASMRAPDGPPWFATASFRKRLVSELSALTRLSDNGIDAKIFGAGRHLEVRASKRGPRDCVSRSAVLRLDQGFPDTPPAIVTPVLLRRPGWRSDRCLADVVRELIEMPVCAPGIDERYEPAEPHAYLRRTDARSHAAGIQ